MNHVGYFEIQSAQPERDIAFYETVFGWKFIRDPQIPIEYYRIEGAGLRGAMLKRPARTPPPDCGTNAFTCSVEVKDFDETARRIGEKGGQVAMPKFAIPGVCWQGYFLDPDQNVIGIFQPDPKAK